MEGEFDSSKTPNEAVIVHKRKRHAPKLSGISIGKREKLEEINQNSK